MKFYFDGPPKLQINETPKKLTKFILQKKFKVLDRKTRKYLNIYNSLHSQDSMPDYNCRGSLVEKVCALLTV